MERSFICSCRYTIPTLQWKKSKMKSWLSESTLKLICSKHSCYKHMKADPSLWPKYKSLHNEVCNVTRRDIKYMLNQIQMISAKHKSYFGVGLIK